MRKERAAKRERERETGIARDDAQAVSLNVAAFDMHRMRGEGREAEQWLRLSAIFATCR